MDIYVDLIIDHIGQLCVIPAQNGGPQRGDEMGNLGIIPQAAVAINGETIAAVGPRDEILANYSAPTIIDAGDRLVTPGLVDPHTHLVWAGDRAEEFEMRIQGATYMEIAEAGGGINRTVRLTRLATLTELIEATAARLDRMLRYGTTTVEIKTGYGLNQSTEISMLSAIALLDSEHPMDIVPTFLGAHDFPAEYADNHDAYVKLLVNSMIPAAAAWRAEHWPGPMCCDVFCEDGVFTLEQTQRILEAGQQAGFGLRVHADEFKSLGAVSLAAQYGAVSVDHLLATTPEDVQVLAQSDTIAVLLPATPFGLGIRNTAPAQALLEAGAAIALATDCNPGTAWSENMQFVMALAARYLRLTPAQALVAATINAAFAVQCGDLAGSLEPGKRADLVIWDVPDYRHLSYRFGTNLARSVIKRGNVVFSA